MKACIDRLPRGQNSWQNGCGTSEYSTLASCSFAACSQGRRGRRQYTGRHNAVDPLFMLAHNKIKAEDGTRKKNKTVVDRDLHNSTHPPTPGRSRRRAPSHNASPKNQNARRQYLHLRLRARFSMN